MDTVSQATFSISETPSNDALDSGVDMDSSLLFGVRNAVLWAGAVCLPILNVIRMVLEEARKLMQVTPVTLSYMLLGGFVTIFSMISLLVKEKLYFGEAVLGTGFGILVGPYCASIFDPRDWGFASSVTNTFSLLSRVHSHSLLSTSISNIANTTIFHVPSSHPTPGSTAITLEITRIVLAVGLFAIGVELPRSYVLDHARSISILVVSTMTFGWFVAAGLIRVLFPSLTYTTCLVISACLTPTDPILANSIIQGKFALRNVPRHVRMILSAESAVNDGLAYPFLTIALGLTFAGVEGKATGDVVWKWILVGVLYQVAFGIFIGTLLGWTCSVIMRISYRKGFIDRESLVSQFLALSILTVGLASLLGSDDLLASFAAGTALSWNGHFKNNVEGEVFSSVIDLVLNCACFIYVGAWLPFAHYNMPELGVEPWRLIVLLVGILLLRRIPCLLAVYKWIPDVRTWREALFCGHFGPMGVGAIFISTLALSELPSPSYPPQNQINRLALVLQPIVSFIVLGSILIHGLSIPIFWYGSRTLSLTRTLSRTWTTRSNLILAPEWLISTRSASDIENTAGTSRSAGQIVSPTKFNPLDSNREDNSKLHRIEEEDVDEDVESSSSVASSSQSVRSITLPVRSNVD